jgi:ribosome-associated toxin RatA of RatAB toxin-antitoxin module
VAELTTEHVFDGSRDEVYAAIRAYDRYPDYIPGVTGIEVKPAKKPGSVCQVRYELKIVKSFHYTLNMFEKPGERVWWDMDDSNIMKQSNGSWTLADAGPGKTKATYALDIVFKGLVPGAIVDQITKANLPGLFKGMQKLMDDLKAEA